MVIEKLRVEVSRKKYGRRCFRAVSVRSRSRGGTVEGGRIRGRSSACLGVTDPLRMKRSAWGKKPKNNSVCALDRGGSVSVSPNLGNKCEGKMTDEGTHYVTSATRRMLRETCFKNTGGIRPGFH